PLRAGLEGHHRAARRGHGRARARRPHGREHRAEARLTGSCWSSRRSSGWPCRSTSPTGSTTPPTRSPRWSRPGFSPPRVAVVWAAIFNFIAFLVFQTHVANTVGKTVDPDL